MTQAMAQDDFDLAKFIKLMKMTTATTDGETLNSIRMANAMLKKNGLDWEFLRTKITIIADPFTSIPEPPKAAATPRPQHTTPQPRYQAQQPAQRAPQDGAKFATYTNIIQRSFPSLTVQEQAIFLRVTQDWASFAALYHSDFNWLENTARELDLHPRDVFQIQQFFDVLDLAPLSPPEVAQLRRVKGAWTRQNDRLHNRDFNWLNRLYLRHKPRTTASGKAKRIF